MKNNECYKTLKENMSVSGTVRRRREDYFGESVWNSVKAGTAYVGRETDRAMDQGIVGTLKSGGNKVEDAGRDLVSYVGRETNRAIDQGVVGTLKSGGNDLLDAGQQVTSALYQKGINMKDDILIVAEGLEEFVDEGLQKIADGIESIESYINRLEQGVCEYIYRHALPIAVAATASGVITAAGACIESATALAAAITVLTGFQPWIGAAVGIVWGVYCEAQVAVTGIITAFEMAGGIQVMLEQENRVRGPNNTRYCGSPNWMNNSLDDIAGECNIPYNPDYVQVIPQSIRQQICNHAPVICGVNTAINALPDMMTSQADCVKKIAAQTVEYMAKGIAPELAAKMAASNSAVCLKEIRRKQLENISGGFSDHNCAGNLQLTWCGCRWPSC